MATKFRVQGVESQYLMAAPAESNLTRGTHNTNDRRACFRVHTFEVLTLNSVPGQVVVMEALEGGRHIHGSSTGSIHVRSGSQNLSTITHSDDRFFRISINPGDRYCSIRHLHSGKWVSASGSNVSLVDHTGAAENHMLFEKFPCTHT